MFRAVSQANLIISYRQNTDARTPMHRFLSRCYNLAAAVLGHPIRDAPTASTFSGKGNPPATNCEFWLSHDCSGDAAATGRYLPGSAGTAMNPRPKHQVLRVMKMRTLWPPRAVPASFATVGLGKPPSACLPGRLPCPLVPVFLLGPNRRPRGPDGGIEGWRRATLSPASRPWHVSPPETAWLAGLITAGAGPVEINKRGVTQRRGAAV